jgi:hypothetical protein
LRRGDVWGTVDTTPIAATPEASSAPSLAPAPAAEIVPVLSATSDVLAPAVAWPVVAKLRASGNGTTAVTDARRVSRAR